MEKFVIFKLGDEEFGVWIKNVVEIIRVRKVNPLPELPDFLSGVITVRGAVIPLLDMRKRFSIASTPVNERIIIVRAGAERVGLIVDEVSEIAAFTKDEVTQPPGIFKGLKTEYLTGIGKKDSRVILLLNLDKILSSEELIVLSESTEALDSV